MKSISVLALFVLVLNSAAQAYQSVINDLLDVVMTCQESRGEALVVDGAKTLTLSRDQLGQLTLTVVQKDQFSRNISMIEDLPLTQKACQGFVPCEYYEADQGASQFFVNFLSPSQPIAGHLTSPAAGQSISFAKKNDSRSRE